MSCRRITIVHFVKFCSFQASQIAVGRQCFHDRFMNAIKRATERGRLHNRIAAIMVHIDGYDSRGVSRIAVDAGVSRSEVSRFLHGRTNPSYVIVERLHLSLERKLGRKLPITEVVSEFGTYPTAYVCDLMECRGCLPAYAYNQENEVLAEHRELRSGQWTGDVEPVSRVVAKEVGR